jgi:hypothetical protein
LATAIRAKDSRHLITVGLIATPDRGQFCGFVPDKIAGDLDYVSIHLYPEKGKIKEAVDRVAGFAIGKPVVIEEMFPLHCSARELEEFIERSRPLAAGWIGFYWGQPPEELRRSQATGDLMTLGWLELFERKAKAMTH